MRAGKLRDRVNIQRPIVAVAADGERIVTWLNYVLDVPAQVQNATADEIQQSSQVVAEATHTISMRYMVLPPIFRVTFEGVNYEILGTTNPDGLRRETMVFAKTVVEPMANPLSLSANGGAISADPIGVSL